MSKRPPWWRPFARRKWDKQEESYRIAAQKMDQFAAFFKSMYPASEIDTLVLKPSLFEQLKRTDTRYE